MTRKQTEEAKFEAFSVMCEKVNELEKENAELRDDNKVIADNYSKMEQKFYDNLTKAKDVIEKLLNAFASNNFFEEEELSAMEEAEQFLKELEE